MSRRSGSETGTTALIFGFLLVALPAHGQDWNTIPVGTSADIRAIENGSFSEKWIVGNGGFVASSSLGRTVWTPADVGTSADLLSIHQSSFGQVWVGGSSGMTRLKSGSTWLPRDIPSSEDYVLFTRSSGTSWAVGTGGSIYRSLDGGQNWFLMRSEPVTLHGGNGFINSTAYVVGGAGTILKTVDGGATWTYLPSGNSAELYDFVDAGANGLLVVGESGTILRSMDGGASWNKIPSGTLETLYGIATSGASTSWLVAVGSGGKVLKSTNGGASWCSLNAGTTADLYGVEAVSNDEYIVVGAGGLLLRTTTGGGSCSVVAVEPASSDRPWITIEGPYPNPVQMRGFVSLAAGHDQAVRVELVDVTGRRVAKLLEGRLAAGERRGVTLDALGLSPGVYLLNVFSDEQLQATRRVLILR